MPSLKEEPLGWGTVPVIHSEGSFQPAITPLLGLSPSAASFDPNPFEVSQNLESQSASQSHFPHFWASLKHPAASTAGLLNGELDPAEPNGFLACLHIPPSQSLTLPPPHLLSASSLVRCQQQTVSGWASPDRAELTLSQVSHLPQSCCIFTSCLSSGNTIIQSI